MKGAHDMDSKISMDVNVNEQMQAPRTIDVITAEIWLYKQQAGMAILEIGHRLKEAKAMLQHGEWLPWLEEKVQFSERHAQNFMRLADEYGNTQSLADLGATKALILLALPPSEREDFAAEKHMVNGEEKTVEEMSSRELKKAIQERDHAREEVEELQEQLTLQLDEQQKVYDVDMEQAREKIRKAEHDASEADNKVKKLQDQLKALEETKSQPDKKEMDAIKKEVEEKLQKKIQKAEDEKKKAHEAKEKVERELAAQRDAQSKAEQIILQEKLNLKEQVNELQKKLTVASSSDMAIFRLHFEQTQGSINSMAECIHRMEDAGDVDNAGKLKGAMKSLLESALAVLA